jgi:Protein of unknown function (DUF3887)
MRHLVTALLFLSIAVRATAAIPSRSQSVARRFLVNFAGNRLEAAANDFNEQMKATVTPTVLADFKQQFDRDLGRFLAVAAVRESTDGDFPVVELTARFEKMSALVQVTFDAAGKIGALHFDRVAANDPQLERIAREVLNAFNGRRFEEIGKYLDVKMNAQLPPSALETLYRDVTAVYGKFKSVTEARYTTQGELRIVEISAEYEKLPMLFEVVFNSNGRVAGWSFRPPKPTP